MNFLSPWFLVGGLAIAGPIIFHLIRRAVRDRIPFSSIMFLRPTPPRLTKRSRIEHWWLLILRCLCLLLLAVGFARPFFAKDNMLPSTTGEARRVVLLLDTSASMRREGVWEQAKSLAAQYLDRASLADEVAVLTFDRQIHSVVSFADWSSWSPSERAGLARERLANVTPSWKGTQLGLALTSAAEQFATDASIKQTAMRREVILITDLQEGGKLDGLQGHEWPTGVKVTLEQIKAKHGSNAGLGVAPEITSSIAETNTRVRITNARDSEQEKFGLNWSSDSPGKPAEIYLPPGQTRMFPTPKIAASSKPEKLQLSGDAEPFDNSLYLVPPETEHLQIAWFGSDAQNDPSRMRYYFQRVFPKTPQREVQVVSPTTNLVFSAPLLKQSAFAVIATNLNAAELAATREWLAGGKTALLVLSDAQMGPTIAGLTGGTESRVSEATGDYALFSEIDFTHPIFTPFADPRFSDFTHIHFWKHRRWEIPAALSARVLVKFDDGSPALAQVRVGKGNLIVLTSGWNPGDSQFAVSSKFPPLMEMLLDWSGAAAPVRFQFETGDSIPSPITSGGEVQWKTPDGKVQTLAAGAAFGEAGEPGIYLATAGGKEHRFAVNLPLDESRTAPLSEDELARLGVPLKTVEPSLAKQQQAARHQERAELESHQKLWRWLIVGALIFVLGETLLGGWLARRVKPMEATT